MMKKSSLLFSLPLVVTSFLSLSSMASAAPSDKPEKEAMGKHYSAEDRAAYQDARIAALKAGLRLTADQQKYWPALETQLREIQKAHQDRMMAWRNEKPEDHDALARLSTRADYFTARAAELKSLVAAAEPLYKTLDEGQKRRFGKLMRFEMGEMKPSWRRESTQGHKEEKMGKE